MADDRYLDLDAFFDTQEVKEPVVKVLGQEWVLPVSPPAKAMLRAQRVVAAAIDAKERLETLDKDAQIPEDLKELASFDLHEHACALLGEHNLEAMLDKGLRHDQLLLLLSKVMAMHQGGGSSPNRAARRKGGRSSSKTS